MNGFRMRPAAQRLQALALMALLITALPAAAAPGAHGPNGEHLDVVGPAAAGSAQPRVEAHSESFELVGTLHSTRLSVLVDRYDSNEPVLNATLEVDSGGIKAKATFHADQGDYAFDAPQLLAQLRKPGEHALVFTLLVGKESDLLDGTLQAAAGGVAATAKTGHGHGHDHDDGHGHGPRMGRAAWLSVAVAALGLVGGIAWWRQRRRAVAPVLGGL